MAHYAADVRAAVEHRDLHGAIQVGHLTGGEVAHYIDSVNTAQTILQTAPHVMVRPLLGS